MYNLGTEMKQEDDLFIGKQNNAYIHHQQMICTEINSLYYHTNRWKTSVTTVKVRLRIEMAHVQVEVEEVTHQFPQYELEHLPTVFNENTGNPFELL